jgi:holo-[acyl-carrier protein] synthase
MRADAQRGVAYLATRFSAKEAFSKAMGLGMRMPMTWRACEILQPTPGKPTVRLHGVLAEWFEARGLSAHVSVSDERTTPPASCVVERTLPP